MILITSLLFHFLFQAVDRVDHEAVRRYQSSLTAMRTPATETTNSATKPETVSPSKKPATNKVRDCDFYFSIESMFFDYIGSCTFANRECQKSKQPLNKRATVERWSVVSQHIDNALHRNKTVRVDCRRVRVGERILFLYRTWRHAILDHVHGGRTGLPSSRRPFADTAPDSTGNSTRRWVGPRRRSQRRESGRSIHARRRWLSQRR